LLYAIAAACLAVTAAIALLKPAPLPAPTSHQSSAVDSGLPSVGSTQVIVSVNGSTISAPGYVCLPPRTACRKIVEITPAP
jgi:hypothetical protein